MEEKMRKPSTKPTARCLGERWWTAYLKINAEFLKLFDLIIPAQVTTNPELATIVHFAPKGTLRSTMKINPILTSSRKSHRLYVPRNIAVCSQS
jgi:hypothetical protein